MNLSISPKELDSFKVIIMSSLIGGIGGVLYCLRAVYLNFSVKNRWEKRWEVWYYLRPVASLITGAISYLFIKSGLLLLEANLSPDSSFLGVYALALIAGLNVDKFLSRIEDLAKATWGIDKSRSSKSSDDDN